MDHVTGPGRTRQNIRMTPYWKYMLQVRHGRECDQLDQNGATLRGGTGLGSSRSPRTHLTTAAIGDIGEQLVRGGSFIF